MKANGKFRADEKAVSPVIGVILMVAITVILAAIIAAFVFGMAPPEMAPQASIRGTVAQDAEGNHYIRLEHQGGDTLTITAASIKVIVNDTAILEDDYPKGTETAVTQLSTGEVAYIWMNAGTPTYKLSKTAPGDTDVAGSEPKSGQSVTVKIVDVASQQLIADMTVRG